MTLLCTAYHSDKNSAEELAVRVWEVKTKRGGRQSFRKDQNEKEKLINV